MVSKPTLGYGSRTDAVLDLRARGHSTAEISRMTGIPSKHISTFERTARSRGYDPTRANESAAMKGPEKHTATPGDTKAPPKADPPREATKDQRRRIVLTLDEHYDTKASVYIGDMSDQAIARQLNVPVAWVAREREDLFGPCNDNEDNKKIQADLKAARDCLQSLEKAVETMVDKVADARNQIDAIGRRADRLAKDLR